ncbi:putative FBD-associated F-box protein At1g55030 [Chenopodium quinoa]|uniref:putative FBD-associated F-box protein At1g55030 n=1 Tax=Chenopodium quinoa TaxID=63459 RepID=UPI000B779DA7|nr:putative FBD-associated F-box protein At1g55030 [Chenopodium quinoa]
MTVTYKDCERKKCMDFIRSVLCKNDIPCLQRFHFEIFSDFETIHVEALINFALRREIWELYLNKEWVHNKIMRLPMDLSARETLRVLKLRGNFEFNVCLSLHLPKLETLYLFELRCVGKDVIKILTSGCPVLKELLIEYCEGLKELSIDSLTLNKLKIHNESQSIAVKAPNVRYLDLDVKGARYEASNLSSLVEARVRLGDYEPSKLPWQLELIR